MSKLRTKPHSSHKLRQVQVRRLDKGKRACYGSIIMNPDIKSAAIGFLPFLFAICFHEYAHGWVARLKGDRTAEIMGRLTLNPMAHADLVGTIILPLFGFLFPGFMMFGWAKPVPVDYRNLKNPRADIFWVALAGPLSNILLGFVGVIVLWAVAMFGGQLSGGGHGFLKESAISFIRINTSLAVFNMIPIHPLDGGKIIARFLPYSINRMLEDNEQTLALVLMALVFTGGLGFVLKYPFMAVMGVYEAFLHLLIGVMA